MNEAAISAKLIAELRERGGKFYKASDRFHAAVPDIIGCHKGMFIAIETKIHPNKTTKLQEFELNDYVYNGGAAFVVTYHRSNKRYVVNALFNTNDIQDFTNHREAVLWILKQSFLHISKKLSTT